MPAHPDPAVQARRWVFAAVVRRRRKALGLSQERLADRAGFDRRSVNRIERASYSPSLDRVSQLADALEFTLGELFVLVDAERAVRDLAARAAS
jgi:putative transcriptional regulator